MAAQLGWSKLRRSQKKAELWGIVEGLAVSANEVVQAPVVLEFCGAQLNSICRRKKQTGEGEINHLPKFDKNDSDALFEHVAEVRGWLHGHKTLMLQFSQASPRELFLPLVLLRVVVIMSR